MRQWLVNMRGRWLVELQSAARIGSSNQYVRVERLHLYSLSTECGRACGRCHHMEAISHTDEKWLDLLCMERLCLMPFSPVKILTSNVVNYGEFCLIQKDSDSCDLIKSVTAQVMNLFSQQMFLGTRVEKKLRCSKQHC